MVVAVESNDKRPNILLDEEDTCSFFPLAFSFLLVPTSVYFFPSLFFFLFSVEGKERTRDGDGTIQFRIKKKTTERANDRARWRKQLPIFVPLAPVYIDVITISGGSRSGAIYIHDTPIPQIIPPTRLRRFMESILPDPFSLVSSRHVSPIFHPRLNILSHTLPHNRCNLSNGDFSKLILDSSPFPVTDVRILRWDNFETTSTTCSSFSVLDSNGNK